MTQRPFQEKFWRVCFGLAAARKLKGMRRRGEAFQLQWLYRPIELTATRLDPNENAFRDATSIS